MANLSDEKYGSDYTGRVMSIEQRLRGLQGRVRALEMRVSTRDSPIEASEALDEIEFIAACPVDSVPDDIVLRLEALEKKAGPAPGPDTLDVSGIVGGLALIGAGLLLSAGSFDLLKNPLLAFGTGIALLAGAGMRRLRKKRL